jgi:SAM-dependent MidA family methyltransferase
VEIRVGELDGALVEVPVGAAPADAMEASRLAPDASSNGRLALQHGARAWLARSLGLVERGRIVCIDYCVEMTSSMVERPQHEWLRTYRRHGHGAGPLEVPGEQDVTCEVAIDQLASVRGPTSDDRQSQWLEARGLAELVDAARQHWRAAAARPDLAALAARSRVAEAGALIDPGGLGAFRVLEWEID